MLRILNAALRNVVSKERIEPEDDLDTIKRKIAESANEPWGFVVYRHELLEDDMMLDAQVQEYRNKLREENVFNENGYLPERATRIKSVSSFGEGLTVEFFEAEMEYEPYQDWVGWADICRLYGCRILSDLYDIDKVEEYQFTDMYEMVDGELQTTHISHNLDIWDYYNCFEKLIKLDADRYLPLKILALKALETNIHEEINRSMDYLNNPRESEDHISRPTAPELNSIGISDSDKEWIDQLF